MALPTCLAVGSHCQVIGERGPQQEWLIFALCILSSSKRLVQGSSQVTHHLKTVKAEASCPLEALAWNWNTVNLPQRTSCRSTWIKGVEE